MSVAVISTVLELVPYFLLATAIGRIVSGGVAGARLPVLAEWGVAALVGRAVLWSWAMYLSHVVAFGVLHDLQSR